MLAGPLPAKLVKEDATDVAAGTEDFTTRHRAATGRSTSIVLKHCAAWRKSRRNSANFLSGSARRAISRSSTSSWPNGATGLSVPPTRQNPSLQLELQSSWPGHHPAISFIPPASDQFESKLFFRLGFGLTNTPRFNDEFTSSTKSSSTSVLYGE